MTTKTKEQLISVEELQDWVEKAFANDGPFSEIFDGYNYRHDQVALAQLIAQSIAEGKAGFGEAGTGTGKSFATLIPAAIYAALLDKRVLLVTHNIALQQQLYDGDVPIVTQVLEKLGLEFRPALIKGKGNFICTKNLISEYQKGDTPERPELERVLSDIRNEKGEIAIGDKDKMSFQPSDKLWSRISVNQNTDCTNCPFKKDSCFIEHNKEIANQSNLVISNQFMLMNDIDRRRKSDFQPNSGTLPDYDVLIVDEAHHLEEVASSSLGLSLDIGQVNRTFRRIEYFFGKRGPIRDFDSRKLENIRVLTRNAKEALIDMLKEGRKRLIKRKNSFADYITETFPLENDKFLFELSLEITRLKQFILDIPSQKTMDGLCSSLEGMHNTVLAIQEGVAWDDKNNIYWMQRDGEEFSSLHSTPLEVNSILREALFDRMPVILSSATMKFDSDLHFFAKKVGSLEPDEYNSIFIPAPFKYDEQVCFYVPADALDCPSSKDGPEAMQEYDEYCMNEMYQLVQMSRGRAFLLFTSNVTLNNYYERLAPLFEEMGYKCFRQGGDLDRNQMIEQFTKHGNAVLFGSSTFWEGISVKGRELSLVVMHKIPFDVPNPISKAREVKIKENGGNVFLESQVFPAIIKYKQGFGRLIRHEDDKGVFCVLDGRIFSKKESYGKYFLRGTPRTTYAVEKHYLTPFFE